MGIKAVIWDLDGTLIHFKIDFIRARRKVISILRKFGAPRKILSIKNKFTDTIEMAKNFFYEKGYDKEEINKIIQEANRAIINVEREAALQATLINGIKQVLDFIKANGLKQAIFTYNTRENAELSLKKANIIEYFEIIVGRDSISNPKPHPEHLLYICKKLNVKPHEIVVIGDSGRDIEAGIKVGAYTLGLKTLVPEAFRDHYFYKANKIIEIGEIPSKLIKAIQDLK